MYPNSKTIRTRIADLPQTMSELSAEALDQIAGGFSRAAGVSIAPAALRISTTRSNDASLLPDGRLDYSIDYD